MIGRRTLLGTGAGLLTAPALVRAASQTTLRFVPQTDVTGFDPIWSVAQVTRNYALLVFDTLFGVDAAYRAQPQMAEGAGSEDGDRRWTVRLRPGLRFHDGTPVLARDCAASLRRWGKRDSFGQVLFDAVDELSATDDRTLLFRMKRPFPMLLDALAKSTANLPAIMPERLAATDPFKQTPEVVGSGPFRLLPDETVSGVRVAFARNEDYRPREDGPVEWTAGPKVVHFDRVTWEVIPDPATAAAALQSGEVDWVEQPSPDYLDLLRRRAGITVATTDPSGSLPALRMNWLYPPFDNPAIRRLVLRAVSQTDFMQAVVGTDEAFYRTGVGFFPPGTACASEAGLDRLQGPADFARLRRELAATGYAGQPVVVLGVSDRAAVKAMGDVAVDMFGRMGLNVDYQVGDSGTITSRANKKEPPAQGGWNVYFGIWGGLSVINPVVQQYLRSDGGRAVAGWPNSSAIEALRAAWLEARLPAEQKAVSERIQLQALDDVPYVPLGQFFQPIAYRSDLTGIVTGFPIFWNIRRS